MINHSNIYNKIYNILTLFFIVLVLYLPINHADIFNKDFLQYVSFKDRILNEGILKSIVNNTFVFYILFNILKNISAFNIIYGFQILTLISFFYFFRKINSRLLLSIILIFFFTVFSNQIRTASALIFAFFFLEFSYKKKWSIAALFALLTFLTHILPFIVIVLYSLLNMAIYKKKWLIIGSSALIIFILFMLYVNDRFNYYLQVTNYYSFFGVFSVFILMLLKDYLTQTQFKNLIFMVGISILLGYQALLSSRIVEIIIFIAYVATSTNLSHKIDIKVRNLNIIVLLSFMFFFYRFTVIYYFAQDGLIFRDYIYNIIKMII